MERENAEVTPESYFMRLFVKHEPVLRAYARTMLPDWNCVDDAIQESSVTMWQKLEQLNSEDGFLPWAKVIVRYKCLQTIDRLRREKPVLSDEVLKLLATEADNTTAADFGEMRIALSACMKKFSHAQQELLLAPYGSAGRVKELADHAGKSANAFYKLLGRLREKLTSCIQARLGAEGA